MQERVNIASIDFYEPTSLFIFVGNSSTSEWSKEPIRSNARLMLMESVRSRQIASKLPKIDRKLGKMLDRRSAQILDVSAATATPQDFTRQSAAEKFTMKFDSVF
jgi:hypothetical protein